MGCSVERSPKYVEINAMLAAGLGLQTIEKKLPAEGFAIKRETIKRHLELCLPPSAVVVSAGEAVRVVSPEEVRQRRSESGDARDFASLVHDRALKALERSELAVTTKDGLAAQAIIDRREERSKDRDFALNLAILLSGGGQMAPRNVIDDESDESPYLIVEPD